MNRRFPWTRRNIRGGAGGAAVAPPTISSVVGTLYDGTNYGGSHLGGTSVVITGTGFTGVAGAASVKFGATNATSYVVDSDIQITAVSPAGTLGASVTVSVANSGGTTTTGSGVGSGGWTYFDPESILSTKLVENFDSTLGIALVSLAVDSWTGTKLGIVCTAPSASNRPVYGADGTFFEGEDVVQTAVTGSLCLYSAALGSDLLAAGTSPCIITIARLRSTVGARQYTASLLETAGTFVELATFGENTGAAVVGGVVRTGGSYYFVTGDASATTPPTMREAWADASAGSSVRTNVGTTYSTAGGVTIEAAVRRVCIGVGNPSLTGPSNSSIRGMHILSSKPTLGQALAIQAYWTALGGFDT